MNAANDNRRKGYKRAKATFRAPSHCPRDILAWEIDSSLAPASAAGQVVVGRA